MPALKSGSKVGSYEVLAALGAGGMGEVYRARDSKLKRDVAIKALPEGFSRDADRVARFQREAEVLASLNHPNIAHIYGLEETEGSRCLVLEFVDGETLQERIRRGPIPLDDAIEFARQIAEALEAAHERGIVHRDLKPANVKVSSTGQVSGNGIGGGDWSNNGVILFSNDFSGLYRVSLNSTVPEEVTRLNPQQASHRLPHFLPDGDHFLFYSTGTPEVRGVYMGSLSSKVSHRLMDAETAAVFAPPDYILFGRAESLYAQRLDMSSLQLTGEPVVLADGSQEETVLLETLENKNARDWSPDGHFILFTAVNPKTDRDIWALPLDGDRKPLALAQTTFVEDFGTFSADSYWIAYQSNETGRNEIFVRPFPGPGRSVQVSTGGGTRAQWKDSRVLYLDPDNRVMSVPVRLQAPGTIEPGTPEALFTLRPSATFIVARDGRLLVNLPLEDIPTPPITVLLNWAVRKK